MKQSAEATAAGAGKADRLRNNNSLLLSLELCNTVKMHITTSTNVRSINMMLLIARRNPAAKAARTHDGASSGPAARRARPQAMSERASDVLRMCPDLWPCGHANSGFCVTAIEIPLPRYLHSFNFSWESTPSAPGSNAKETKTE